MLDHEWALAFARDWIASWNAHDLPRILSHYTDDFVMSSPLIVARLGHQTGTLSGKESVAAYWRPSLTLAPPLRFELLDVLVGVAELTIYYRSVGRRVVAETLCINGAGKATRGIAQWSALHAVP
jgi:SnoaL-like protein